MYTFVVVFDRVQRAGGVITIGKVTVIGRFTAVRFQMLSQIYQVLAAKETHTKYTEAYRTALYSQVSLLPDPQNQAHADKHWQQGECC